MGADNLCEFEIDGVRCPAISRHYTVSGHRTCGENHGPQRDPKIVDIVVLPAMKECYPDWDKYQQTPVHENDVEITLWGCECGDEGCTWQMTTNIAEARFRLDKFFAKAPLRS